MTDVKAIGQKMGGKMKQLEGDINQHHGGMHGVKGGLQKLSGKLDEVMADAKMQIDKEKHHKTTTKT